MANFMFLSLSYAVYVSHLLNKRFCAIIVQFNTYYRSVRNFSNSLNSEKFMHKNEDI